MLAVVPAGAGTTGVEQGDLKSRFGKPLARPAAGCAGTDDEHIEL